MSVAPKSTVWLQKEFRPRTEFETVKLMLPPSISLNWPSHCDMATPAKLDPVELSCGPDAEAGPAVSRIVPNMPATLARVSAMSALIARRRANHPNLPWT